MPAQNLNTKSIVEQTLDELEVHTQEELGKANSLRKKIGLVEIVGTEVSTSLYSEHSSATTKYNPEKGTSININLVPFVALEILKGTKKEYTQIMQYFDLFRQTVKTPTDSKIILSFICQEDHDLEKFIIESSENGEEDIKELQAKHNAIGVDMEKCFKFLNENAETTRQNLENSLPEMKKLYEQANVSFTLAHEIDHIDVINTELYDSLTKTHQRAMKKLSNGKHIKAFAEASIELLAKEAEVLTLLETRGIIYDFMGKGGITQLETNRKEIAEKVVDRFIKGYVNNKFSVDIVETIIIKELAEGNMDDITSNYISGIVKIPGKLEEIKNMPKPEGVNPEVADRVLYEELPKWKKKFIDNAADTTEASINAMIHNPEGFEKARYSKTLDSYIITLLIE